MGASGSGAGTYWMPLPAAPIGLEQRTAAIGSHHWPNLRRGRHSPGLFRTTLSALSYPVLYQPCLFLSRRHTMAIMEPVQLTITAAVVSIVNTSRIILEYMRNRAKRRQHKEAFDEDMDTDIPESTGCGNWDIMAAVGLVDTVER
ncbi:hypothetical protein UY3_13090 [Chelonia mydas]|uniref:Uncharacterized protein n=1 Tax=Chelonia mydas TaxID=8469 RepID=M7BNM0_CHEMY|nr:hypothetical protein UY3_13090 [Chelonia mydas]